jgi:hypothetical protein
LESRSNHASQAQVIVYNTDGSQEVRFDSVGINASGLSSLMLMASPDSSPLELVNAYVWVKETYHLAKLIPAVNFQSGQTTTVTVGTLYSGDINSNNEIDIFDYAMFVQAYRDEDVNGPANFDADGDVDIFDYNLLVQNYKYHRYGQTGP